MPTRHHGNKGPNRLTGQSSQANPRCSRQTPLAWMIPHRGSMWRRGGGTELLLQAASSRALVIPSPPECPRHSALGPGCTKPPHPDDITAGPKAEDGGSILCCLQSPEPVPRAAWRWSPRTQPSQPGPNVSHLPTCPGTREHLHGHPHLPRRFTDRTASRQFHSCQ